MASNDTLDVFPLVPGLRFTYRVLSDSLSRDAFPLGAWRDSGFVEYYIRDSSAATTSTRQWKIDEVRHLLHYVYTFNIFDSVLVSTHWEDSTVTLNLSEQLSGSHELRCEGLIWSFPFQDVRSLSGWDTTISVFRYSSDAKRVLVAQDNYTGGALTLSDSVFFDSSHGMLGRSILRGGWAHTAPAVQRTILLAGATLGKPAEVK